VWGYAVSRINDKVLKLAGELSAHLIKATEGPREAATALQAMTALVILFAAKDEGAAKCRRMLDQFCRELRAQDIEAMASDPKGAKP